MAKRRIINTKMWSDTWISDLDPVEKLLFFYLLTNERTNLCGLYELPLKIMAVETGIEREMVEKILKRFSEDKKVFYFDGWILVVNFLKYQEKNPSIEAGIIRGLSELPKEILQTAYRLVPDWGESGDIPKPKPKPKPKLKPLQVYTPEFLEFFKSYPRKEDKLKAFEEWRKLKPSPETIAEIMTGLEKHKQTQKWREGYIVYACKFLKNRNWEDEIIINENPIEKLWKSAK